MDALLIDRWLDGAPSMAIVDPSSVVLARARVAEVARGAGLPEEAVGALVTVASELGHNHLAHARGGVLAVRAFDRNGVAGVEILAADRGDGIVAPLAAIEGRSASRRGLGIGLSGVMSLSDEVDFDVRLGEGTCVWARKLARSTARRREVAILSRPIEGDRVSGDDATFVRTADHLVLALADGLGHGAAARVPARSAVDLVRANRARAPSTAIDEAARALTGTRGSVLSVASIDETRGELDYAGVGNVMTRLVSGRTSRSLLGTSSFLGARPTARAHAEKMALHAHELVIMCSDGIQTRAGTELAFDAATRHPIVIAWELLERHGRSTDDATILVAR